MKPPSENHDLIRWLDGEMTQAERGAFEALLANDPTLSQEAKAMRVLSAGLRSHLPAEMKVPHADFFNSQIQVRIAQMEVDEVRSTQAVRPKLGSLIQWLRQPWLTVAGAVAALVIGAAWLQMGSGAPNESFILSSYAPNAQVHAHAFHDSAAEATVLMLDGLDAIPDEQKVSGIHVRRSEVESEVASTTLYDSEGILQLMISRDAVGNPVIASNSRG